MSKRCQVTMDGTTAHDLFTVVSGGRGAMSESPYCDDRLWLEGKEDICRAFIEAIPPEQRECWDRIFFASETQAQPPRKDVLYFVCVRGNLYVSLPLTEAMVADMYPAAILGVLDHAGEAWEVKRAAAPEKYVPSPRTPALCF